MGRVVPFGQRSRLRGTIEIVFLFPNRESTLFLLVKFSSLRFFFFQGIQIQLREASGRVENHIRSYGASHYNIPQAL